MAVFIRLRGLEPRASAVGADFFQGIGDALGGASELNRACVCQVFPLPADGSLNQLTEERAAVAND